MNHIADSAELMKALCSAAGAGAYGACGAGDISVTPKGSGDFVKTYDGGIIRAAAVISAEGYCGRAELLKRVDAAAEKLRSFREGGVLAVRAPYPARMTLSDDRGFMRFEKDIEIIYAGVL